MDDAAAVEAGILNAFAIVFSDRFPPTRTY